MAGNQSLRGRTGALGGTGNGWSQREAQLLRFGREAGDQALAAGRGAVDSLPFNLGNAAPAGVHAIGDVLGGGDFRRAFANQMAAERAQDQYDAAHYGIARNVGQVLGNGVQLAALGPALGAEELAAGGVRMAQATPLIAREVATLAGAGGAAGVGGQAVSDVVRGRPSSLGDYAGAGLGGVVGALASRGGAGGKAGAISGAATSVAQDLFNGRVPSFDRARDAAEAGGRFGAAGGDFGGHWSDGLKGEGTSPKLINKPKEDLGEGFSRLRTMARGDRTLPGGKTREYLANGKYTYPDSRSYRGAEVRDLVESKFGKSASLSDRQKEAYRLLSNYRVDHTLPRDVGALWAFPASMFGYQASLSDRNL